MSKFANSTVNGIEPYVPGEQPRDKKYIKLNTNENPFYSSPKAVEEITKNLLNGLNRYSDPTCSTLIDKIAKYYDTHNSNVMVTNGSDEALAFCFMAYGFKGVCYPDVTYGFYDVAAGLFGCEVEHIKLEGDFKIDIGKFFNKGKTVIIANPNAQTGICLPLNEIELIIANNAENIVIVDQAYADFSSCNVIPLINKYPNLVVVNTFSKSRSLAGARVGYILAQAPLIEDLKKVKDSFHPYNVNSVSSALACAAIADDEYFSSSVKAIVALRGQLSVALQDLGFEVLPSQANFVLARYPKIGGQELYGKLKSKGVLVRHFSDERIKDYVRITVGSDIEQAQFLKVLREIIYENCRN